ncbi:HTH-type transcriptional regulator CueR [Streptomyces sp. ADI96-02]|uniref:MerR family transcriptional regulator n=1 Tax=unclassified Streptomyces TaxID=2593676 RepID=UPI000FBF23B0|nr:MerR family transcriptional regulator [Streptomyces sp. ADI96-02]RPK69069.1 HTH-type transcriptional regulator CueR [Streptomyces sp. ADI96-02]
MTTPGSHDASARPPLLDIGEVARRTGTSPSALRYYERLGLLAPAARNGLRRAYTPDVLDRIALILNARATGFSLNELVAVLDGEPDAVRRSIASKSREIEDRIREMEQARARLAHALTCRHGDILACPAFLRGLREALPEQER